MMRLALSDAGSGLLRALLTRGGVSRNRILLTEFRSADWQSLTFAGERHRIRFRVPGPDCGSIVARLTTGLEDAEFAIPGQIVADIALVGPPWTAPDGSITVEIEALTIAE
jgi:hypothetical protein